MAFYSEFLSHLLCLAAAKFCSQSIQPPVFTGFVAADSALIASPIAGQIKKVNVVRGQEIAAHSALFDLVAEPDVFTLERAEIELERLRKQHAFAKRTLERMTSLYRHAEISQQTYEKYQQNFDQAQSKFKLGQANLAQAQWRMAQKQQNSFFPGQVKQIFHQAGEFVAAGEPVLELMNQQGFYVTLYIPASQLDQINIGDELRLKTGPGAFKEPIVIRSVATTPEFTPPVIYSVDYDGAYVYRARAEFEACDDCHKKLHPGSVVYAQALVKETNHEQASHD